MVAQFYCGECSTSHYINETCEAAKKRTDNKASQPLYPKRNAITTAFHKQPRKKRW